MKQSSFGFAGRGDMKAVRKLLDQCGLPSDDISKHASHLMAARRGRRVIGCVAMEPYGSRALLRSLAVAKVCRGRGVGHALYEHMLAHAQASGVQELFLLTTTAAPYFKKLGFSTIAREKAPRPIRQTQEFRTLCPSTAVCMTRWIKGEIRYFPKAALRLDPDVPGSRMWAVSLKKAMLTYFEVGPRRRFPRHRHASEQITLVLEGELFFEIEKRKIVCLRPGDTIAIPGNIPHAVFTRSKAARAIDAWSPVMAKYR